MCEDCYKGLHTINTDRAAVPDQALNSASPTTHYSSSGDMWHLKHMKKYEHDKINFFHEYTQ